MSNPIMTEEEFINYIAENEENLIESFLDFMNKEQLRDLILSNDELMEEIKEDYNEEWIKHIHNNIDGANNE